MEESHLYSRGFDKMKLIVITSDSYGGTERRFARFFDHLDRKRDDVMFCLNDRLFIKLQKAGLLRDSKRIIVLRSYLTLFLSKLRMKNEKLFFLISKLDLIINTFFLSFYIFRKKPELVHAVLGGVYVIFPMLFTGMLKVYVTMPSIKLSLLSRENIGIFINLMALKMCCKVDVLSPGSVPEILSYGINREKIYVSPCSFTDPLKYKPSKKKEIVVFAARLEKYHRPELFLRAVKISGKKEAKYFLIGKGNEEAELKKFIDKELSGFNVEMTFMDDIRPVLSEALIFLSLKDENYPSQSLLEAMSSGCSIISGKGGDSNKLVKNDFGFLVDFDASEIAKKIRFLLNNPEIAEEMGEKARKFILDNHTIEKFDVYLRNFWGID